MVWVMKQGACHAAKMLAVDELFDRGAELVLLSMVGVVATAKLNLCLGAISPVVVARG